MKKIFPYQTIGIIGGGQLGRMMCLAAKAMGYRVAVLDPTPNCPCGQVADVEITAEYNDLAAIKKLAGESDVITYEFEKIDVDALVWLEKNTYLPQGSEVLKITRHRYLEKKAISDMGVPVADFALVKNGDLTPLADAASGVNCAPVFREIPLEKMTFPCVIKTTTGGYDGKGQIVLRSAADLAAAQELAS
ncbi:MAG: ATP-grasp domain-containing protein, partial [Defluviitaleaceae bacterium]|nr:ATP-grasp domain-containing protein [Defluviitaleaceae bacterium]